MTTRQTRLFAAVLFLGAPAAALAANADHPYQKIDPRNDAGNPTGDAETDRLNQAQLSQAGGYPRPSLSPRRQVAPGYGRPYAPQGPVYGGGLRGPGYGVPPGYYSPQPPAYYRPPGPPPAYPY